ncbi:MAG: SH3 domain-containing protein, partial [Gracilibacteraceae bacterium]|nr:SH3 domain-containing protein [Gracilibacteraceae bacterium]
MSIKHITTLVLTLALAFALAACGGSAPAPAASTGDEDRSDPEVTQTAEIDTTVVTPVAAFEGVPCKIRTNGTGVRLYSGPGRNYAVVKSFTDGDIVVAPYLEEYVEGWLYIVYNIGEAKGWIEDGNVLTGVRVTASGGLNLRSGPGTDHAVLLTIPEDDIAWFIEENGEWSQIEFDGQVGGYSSEGYLGATSSRQDAGVPKSTTRLRMKPPARWYFRFT